jgi:uncharacterized protein
MRLFILLILIIAGTFLGLALIAIGVISSGVPLQTLLESGLSPEGMGAQSLRMLLLVNHLTSFILPGICWGLIHYKKDWWSQLQLRWTMNGKTLGMAILFLLGAYPLVSKSFELNQLWDLPEFLANAETETAALMKKLLTMDTLMALILNILVIAIIPGIGEELIFRGIIQRELHRYFHPAWAILFASILFSAFHLQFAGFLPRMVLGAILGALYYWTGSLWPSIVVHAFNNGLQVMMVYFYPEMAEADLEQAIPGNWFLVLASLLLTGAIGYWFWKNKQETEAARSTGDPQPDTTV